MLTLMEFLCSRASGRLLARAAYGSAWLLFGLFGLRRRILEENLRRAFGLAITRTEMRRMAVLAVASFVQTLLEFAGARRHSREVEFVFTRREIMDAAQAKGCGVFVMGIHQGNWELLCVAGTRHFAQVNMALKPVGGRTLAEWVRKQRRLRGVHEVPRRGERPAWRLMLDALERQEIVAVVVDQRRKKGVLAPLFGVPAQTNASLFRLWRGHPCPIVPCTIRRLGENTHEIHFWDELVVADDPTWTEEEFLQRNACRMNALVEKMVMWAPDEYFWAHNRWKRS